MKLTYRPLQLPWGPSETETRRGRGVFSADWNNTLSLLGRELDALDATSVVLQVDVTEAQIRLDGGLRANVYPGFPGVRLVVDTPMGTLSWQTDSCEFWRHNARSIALGLEALRAVDRYGITDTGQQYKGWLQLEAGPVETPIETLARIAGHQSELIAPIALFRVARSRAHPDRNGGSRDLWDQVEAAGKALGLI